jgi:hypothetical protein
MPTTSVRSNSGRMIRPPAPCVAATPEISVESEGRHTVASRRSERSADPVLQPPSPTSRGTFPLGTVPCGSRQYSAERHSASQPAPGSGRDSPAPCRADPESRMRCRPRRKRWGWRQEPLQPSRQSRPPGRTFLETRTHLNFGDRVRNPETIELVRHGALPLK